VGRPTYGSDASFRGVTVQGRLGPDDHHCVNGEQARLDDQSTILELGLVRVRGRLGRALGVNPRDSRSVELAVARAAGCEGSFPTSGPPRWESTDTITRLLAAVARRVSAGSSLAVGSGVGQCGSPTPARIRLLRDLAVEAASGPGTQALARRAAAVVVAAFGPAPLEPALAAAS
jgi:hypothetical protein